MENTYAKFLEMPEDERFKYFTGIKLYWWQQLHIKYMSKWWSYMRKMNPHLRAYVLWESIYKGRF